MLNQRILWCFWLGDPLREVEDFVGELVGVVEIGRLEVGREEVGYRVVEMRALGRLEVGRFLHKVPQEWSI